MSTTTISNSEVRAMSTKKIHDANLDRLIVHTFEERHRTKHPSAVLMTDDQIHEDVNNDLVSRQ